MAFTVTFVDGSSTTFEQSARFRFEASGVLVIVDDKEQISFSPQTWAKVSAPAP